MTSVALSGELFPRHGDDCPPSLICHGQAGNDALLVPFGPEVRWLDIGDEADDAVHGDDFRAGDELFQDRIGLGQGGRPHAVKRDFRAHGLILCSCCLNSSPRPVSPTGKTDSHVNAAAQIFTIPAFIGQLNVTVAEVA